MARSKCTVLFLVILCRFASAQFFGEEQPAPAEQAPVKVAPQLGCAAALICVEEQYCTMTGMISETPVRLTEAQLLRRVPMVDCRNPENGVVGKCCRDPNYEDPWPNGGNLPPNYKGGFDQNGFPLIYNLNYTSTPRPVTPRPSGQGRPGFPQQGGQPSFPQQGGQPSFPQQGSQPSFPRPQPGQQNFPRPQGPQFQRPISVQQPKPIIPQQNIPNFIGSGSNVNAAEEYPYNEDNKENVGQEILSTNQGLPADIYKLSGAGQQPKPFGVQGQNYPNIQSIQQGRPTFGSNDNSIFPTKFSPQPNLPGPTQQPSYASSPSPSIPTQTQRPFYASSPSLNVQTSTQRPFFASSTSPSIPTQTKQPFYPSSSPSIPTQTEQSFYPSASPSIPTQTKQPFYPPVSLNIPSQGQTEQSSYPSSTPSSLAPTKQPFYPSSTLISLAPTKQPFYQTASPSIPTQTEQPFYPSNSPSIPTQTKQPFYPSAEQGIPSQQNQPSSYPSGGPDFPSQKQPSSYPSSGPGFPSQKQPSYPSTGLGIPSQNQPSGYPTGAPDFPSQKQPSYPSAGPGILSQNQLSSYPSGGPGFPTQKQPSFGQGPSQSVKVQSPSPFKPSQSPANEIGEGYDYTPPFIQPHTPGAQCGLINKVQTKYNLYGANVPFGEIPWQAMILSNSEKKLLCSGAIIAPNAIITTAECVYGRQPSDVSVKAGEWKLGFELKHEEPLPFEILQVQNIEIHPNYRAGVAGYDMAVLVLQKSFKLDLHVDTLCLGDSPKMITPQKKCISTGWGKYEVSNHLAGAHMNKIQVSLMDNNECRNRLRDAGSFLALDESLLCGKATYQQNNMCQVDIGGPLACDRGDGYYEIIGVYSKDTGCSPVNQVATFSMIDYPWIHSVLGGRPTRPLTNSYEYEGPAPYLGQPSNQPRPFQAPSQVHYHQPGVPCDCREGSVPAGLHQYLPPQK